MPDHRTIDPWTQPSGSPSSLSTWCQPPSVAKMRTVAAAPNTLTMDADRDGMDRTFAPVVVTASQTPERSGEGKDACRPGTSTAMAGGTNGRNGACAGIDGAMGRGTFPSVFVTGCGVGARGRNIK